MKINDMALPKFNETFLPILDVLGNDEIVTARQLLQLVEDKHYSHLSADLRQEITKSGQRLIENRINWGKSYLKKAGLVHYPQRAHVQITGKGKSTLKENVTLENIHADVIQFYEPETNSSESAASFETTERPQDLIDSGFGAIETEVKNELLVKLKEMDPYAFEKVILILLKKMGYGGMALT